MAWKGNFINNMIIKNNFQEYLELGLGHGETWRIIEKCNKTGVDMDENFKKYWNSKTEGNIHITTTDKFFNDNSKKFDIIFIDASHNKNDTCRDFLNSVKCLNENGIIIMHDIYPRDKTETAILTSRGNVFEFWIELVENYNVSCKLNKDNDCVGIFELNKNTDKEIKIKENFEHTYEEFSSNLDKYIKDLTV